MVLATAATVVAMAPAASAAYAVEPTGPAWTPSAGVHSVVVDEAAKRVYIGGSFAGGVAALDALTGALIWQGDANGDVRALALGPNGSLLLGGTFTTVGGTTHRKIASVNGATGAVNNTFKGVVGGTVRDIVVVGGNAYFGGAFTNHGGMNQRGLGAVNATTGANVTTFTAATNGTVYSLGTDGSRLFIGGNFTTVGGAARNQLASVTLANHGLDAWNPPPACTKCNVVWDLTVAGDKVFTAGRNSGGLYAVHRTTGAIVHRLGGFNGDTQAVTVAPDGRLYLGGHFITASGQTRMLVAEYDVSQTTPRLGDFSTRFVTVWPGVWAMTSTSSRLYVGGDFTAAGSQVNGRNRYPYFAMFPSDSAPPADTVAPTVTVGPGNGATGVAVNANVTATFSEPVVDVDNTTFTLKRTDNNAAVTAPVTYDAASRTGTLNPGADLDAGIQYTATLTGGPADIRDTAGNPLTTTSWTFTTAAAPAGDTVAPTVTASTPPNGRTGVSLNANPTATFSETVVDVDPTTFTLTRVADGAPVLAREVRYNTADARWVFDPSPALEPNTQYEARVTTGITDAAGNHLAADVTWRFTTGA